ncbi:MAG: hypothetical protein E6R03_15565 [Hyphomicrobiaceae bacterium]|nr:MAG: hypothetical protein E6R03_15565 [Hyphomicrobiaceae bacterium]
MTARWFRFYSDAVRNPKVARLTDKEFRLWVELLAVASENDGLIPGLDDLKHMLRRRLDHLSTGVERLISVGLIDALATGYAPHNWDKFQYKSDVSTTRVQKHRAKRNVSETPPDTETEDSVEGKPSTDAEASKSVDVVKTIFDSGIAILVAAGSDEKAARSLIGKWRKDAKCDGTVLTILAECQAKQISNPAEWITSAVRTRSAPQKGTSNAFTPNRATSDIGRDVAARLERQADGFRGSRAPVSLPGPRSSGWPD